MSRKKKKEEQPELKDLETESLDENVVDARDQELSELKEALEQKEDRFLRLQAEYENYRRRSQEEMRRRYQDAEFDVCKSWLSVLDNLDRALLAAQQATSDEGVKIAEGVALVKRQALDVMKELGVEEIPALGENFDPEWHEAVQHLEDEAYGENEVIDVLQKGFRKEQRVLRPAMVRVAN